MSHPATQERVLRVAGLTLRRRSNGELRYTNDNGDTRILYQPTQFFELLARELPRATAVTRITDSVHGADLRKMLDLTQQVKDLQQENFSLIEHGRHIADEVAHLKHQLKTKETT